MDARLVDTIARSLATRRVALRGGAALVLSLVQRPQEAQAKCKREGAKCGRRRKCCAGARCRRRRCRCKRGHPKWAGVCCKHRFALADGPGLTPLPGTEFCCKAKGVCSKDGNPAHDDCCQESETCIAGRCCCDGCHGTVVCGGVCCGSASCCNGVCCGSGQVCAETTPGVRTCVAPIQECDADADCYPGETCWGGTCCTAGRMCTLSGGEDAGSPVCCGPNTYCDNALKTCCTNGVICTTGKKVRVRV